MLKSLLSPIFGTSTAQNKSKHGEVLRLASKKQQHSCVRSDSLRLAAPNERRCIVREDVGFYNSLVIGGIYEFEDASTDLTSVYTFTPALRQCLNQHPALNAIVDRVETEAPVYVRVPSLDLRNHVEIFQTLNIPKNQDEMKIIASVLPSFFDPAWPKSIPPWKLIVLPFPKDESSESKKRARYFLALVYSHSVGDGISGLAFHRTLLSALQQPLKANENENSFVVPSSTQPFPAPFDTTERLPISWSFMLSPFLATYLPKFVSSALGYRAAYTNITPTTWTATPVSYDPVNYLTAIEIMEIDSATVANAIKICRKNNAKLTALMLQLIVKALSKYLPHSSAVDNFVSQTAINMRRAVDISDDQMGLFVSGYADVHSLMNSSDRQTNKMWESASKMTKSLALSAAQLEDQPIGLLRFLPSIRSWTLGKLGHTRDTSYEISNLMIFDPATVPSSRSNACHLEKLVFSQPANAMSSPLTFNIVSVKGGNLVCVVSWQMGVLGLEDGDEKAFVNRICEEIVQGFKELE
jgi:hypothetical protein